MKPLKIAIIFTTTLVILFVLLVLGWVDLPSQLIWTLYFPISYLGSGLMFITSPLGFFEYSLIALVGLLNIALIFFLSLALGYVYNLFLRVIKRRTLNISIAVLILAIIVFSYYGIFIDWLVECLDDGFCW